MISSSHALISDFLRAERDSKTESTKGFNYGIKNIQLQLENQLVFGMEYKKQGFDTRISIRLDQLE